MVFTMAPLDLNQKPVLIPGGAGAIRRVIIHHLLRHGARVAVNDIASQQEAALGLLFAEVPETTPPTSTPTPRIWNR